MRVKCLAQEHNIKYPARVRTCLLDHQATLRLVLNPTSCIEVVKKMTKWDNNTIMIHTFQTLWYINQLIQGLTQKGSITFLLNVAQAKKSVLFGRPVQVNFFSRHITFCSRLPNEQGLRQVLSQQYQKGANKDLSRASKI